MTFKGRCWIWIAIEQLVIRVNHTQSVTQQAHTCTQNVPKTRFQHVQNLNPEDAHKILN